MDAIPRLVDTVAGVGIGAAWISLSIASKLNPQRSGA
jgi:hypothetical protein